VDLKAGGRGLGDGGMSVAYCSWEEAMLVDFNCGIMIMGIWSA